MKKLICIIILLFLTSCTFKQNYYELSVDDYTIVVGYDNSEYTKALYKYEIKDELQPNEIIKDVNIYLFDNKFANAEFTNQKNKTVSSDKAVLTKLTIYLEDLKNREYKINGITLDESIKTNCETFNGTYIEKNGKACVIKNKVGNELNVVELYGDYLNLDQDKLDHIVIYVK